MPKLKTKSSAKKRFRFTASGKVKYKPAGKRHGMRKRSQAMIRSTRAMATMKECDAEKIRSCYMPYG